MGGDCGLYQDGLIEKQSGGLEAPGGGFIDFGWFYDAAANLFDLRLGLCQQGFAVSLIASE